MKYKTQSCFLLCGLLILMSADAVENKRVLISAAYPYADDAAMFVLASTMAYLSINAGSFLGKKAGLRSFGSADEAFPQASQWIKNELRNLGSDPALISLKITDEPYGWETILNYDGTHTIIVPSCDMELLERSIHLDPKNTYWESGFNQYRFLFNQALHRIQRGHHVENAIIKQKMFAGIALLCGSAASFLEMFLRVPDKNCFKVLNDGTAQFRDYGYMPFVFGAIHAIASILVQGYYVFSLCNTARKQTVEADNAVREEYIQGGITYLAKMQDSIKDDGSLEPTLFGDVRLAQRIKLLQEKLASLHATNQ